jgi:AraC family transcriptional regulator of adaptative response/methylated-DNA-[protein]-cysteine methyltransferase
MVSRMTNVALELGTAPSPLGLVHVACTSRGASRIAIGRIDDAWPVRLQRTPMADAIARRVVAHVFEQGEAPPLDLEGTAFEMRAWDELRRIPRGTTASYAEIARRLGMPSGARAVARACAANPVALVVPCHRVIGSDGSLRGYRWGLDLKRALLDLERA